MKKLSATVAALSLLLATSAFAGTKGHKAYKCDSSSDDCLAKMATKLKNKGWVGIEYDHDEATNTIRVERVVPDSPAFTAQLEKGDVLLAVNGVDFKPENEEAREKATQKWSPGDVATYTVERAGKKMALEVTLGEIPRDVMAQWVGNHMIEHHMPEPKQVAQK